MVMTYTDNVRRLGISLAVSCFVIASLLLVVRSSAFADSGSIPGLTIDVNPIPSGDLPLDKMIKHKFSATNRFFSRGDFTVYPGDKNSFP